MTRVWCSILSAAMMFGVPSFGSAEEPAPLPEAGSSTIGYPTVEAALTALKAKKGVRITRKQGWTIIQDDSAAWLFAPSNDPAFPSVIQRALVNKPDGAYMETNIRCEASKEACDNFVRRFR
ncbi:MAG: hypothetical protein ACXW3D_04940 [Caulobacteraceae bacterium]